MNDNSELSEDELERRMRAKLLPEGSVRREVTLSDEERRIAEKLLGKDETKRLISRRRDGSGRPSRPFRPMPVQVHYEYYLVPGDEHWPDRYEIRRIENGRQIRHEWKHPGLADEIHALRAQGYKVREIHLDGQPSGKDRKPKSRRMQMINSLKDFR